MAKEYKLGDPRKAETTLGPVVSVASAARIRKQVKDAGELSRFRDARFKLSCQLLRVPS
jgi:acyl-CoA reductase-like NAD-dependent aldehyde dehydrogenase